MSTAVKRKSQGKEPKGPKKSKIAAAPPPSDSESDNESDLGEQEQLEEDDEEENDDYEDVDEDGDIDMAEVGSAPRTAKDPQEGTPLDRGAL